MVTMESESTQCNISSAFINMKLSLWFCFSYFTSNNYEDEENHDVYMIIMCCKPQNGYGS